MNKCIKMYEDIYKNAHTTSIEELNNGKRKINQDIRKERIFT
jgi:hypothetical protein